jgi:hypothetical protein
MSDHDPVDTMAPMAIKSVSTRVRNGITAAARRENLTVGQWLERRFEEWEQAGSPTPVQPAASETATPAPSPEMLRALAEFAREAREDARAAKDEVISKAAAARSRLLLDAVYRTVLGKPQRRRPELPAPEAVKTSL